MKLGSINKMLAGVALALLMTGGVAMASPAPQNDSDSQKQALYPNATREEPDLDLPTQEEAEQLNKGLSAVSAGNSAKARDILKPFAMGRATDNKYAQAMAFQGLANVAYQTGDMDTAIAKLKKAIAIGALPNDTYFQLQYELAQFYAANGQYQKAIDTIDQWRKQGQRQTADSYGLEGVLYYRVKNYKQAIAAINKAKSMTDQSKKNWDQVLAASYAETGQGDKGIAMARKQLAADPTDTTTRHNLVVLLMSANKYPEALKEMEKARDNGHLTTSDGYIRLAKLYLIIGQNSGADPKPYADKALAALDEGQSKGIITPDYDYYKLKGNAALIGGDTSAALDAYTKAAPLGHDGSAELRRAEILASDGKYSASRSAARKAISKGTEHKGRAYVIIAHAERALKNKPAAVKAMKKAAQDPETRDEAQAWLREAGY